MIMAAGRTLSFILNNAWQREKEIYVTTSNVKAIVLVNPIGMSETTYTHGYFLRLVLFRRRRRFLLRSIF